MYYNTDDLNFCKTSLNPDEIIRTKRKTISIEITQDARLLVRAPRFMPHFMINKFLKKKESWILKKRSLAQSRKKRPQIQFKTGSQFYYLGEKYSLDFNSDTRKVDAVSRKIMMPELPTTEKVQEKLRSWYRKQAREIFTRRSEIYQNQYNFKFKKIRITSAKKRWGSCSTKGNLNFSWRLVMTPLDLIDYVIVHEMVHTEQMNHSKEFWSRVEEILPDYKARQKSIKEDGHLYQIF